MFKKTLVLLATTAILLPMEAVYAAGGDDKRSRAQKERTHQRVQKKQRNTQRNTQRASDRRQRSGAPERTRSQEKAVRTRSQEMAVPQTRRRSQNSRGSERQRTGELPAHIRQEVERETKRSHAVGRTKPSSSANRSTRAPRDDAARNAQREPRDVRRSTSRTRQQAQQAEQGRQRQTRSQTSRRQNQAQTQRAAQRQQANQQTRQQRPPKRVADRHNERAHEHARTREQMRAARRGYTGRSDNERNSNTDRRTFGADDYGGGRYSGRGRNNTRGYDNHRDYGYRRHHGRYGHRYTDWGLFFGFNSYYGGWGYNLGYSTGFGYGYNRGYRHGHWYGADYGFFGHWPLYSGYYSARANWLWNHGHHHYHYGSYCPNAQYGRYSGVGYYDSSAGNEVAGVLLGGIVGGIIGAEIDGGRDRTAGTLIGAAVGAAIGSSATRSEGRSYNVGRSYEYGPDNYDANGRHQYENETYQPPEEIRTCIRYEEVNGNYVCTKWTIEYIYDD